ncbi:MAG: sugar phosphate nucleotidyltransferase [Actinomycetes bacterium]
MKAIVLVGGFGTRLRPLTLRAPKQMLPMGRTTMVEQVVARLGSFGVTEVVLSLGYQPDAFQAAFPHAVCAGVRLVYAVEPEPLDTAGAIRFAYDAAGYDERVLALNGDVLTDLDVGDLWARHEAFGGEATIALTPVADPSRYGVVGTADDGRVVAFIEKPPPGTAPSNWINAGTYVLEPAFLARVAPGVRTSIERDIFPAVADAQRLFAVPSDAYWIDAGTPEAYVQAHLDLLDGRREGGPQEGVHPGATVDPTAKVQRSFVGDGCTVGADAEVVDAVLMDDVVVGDGARVERSVVGAGGTVAAGASVTDLSVVGFGGRVGEREVVAGGLVPPPEDWDV